VGAWLVGALGAAWVLGEVEDAAAVWLTKALAARAPGGDVGAWLAWALAVARSEAAWLAETLEADELCRLACPFWPLAFAEAAPAGLGRAEAAD
jgi:hypothetical protein